MISTENNNFEQNEPRNSYKSNVTQKRKVNNLPAIVLIIFISLLSFILGFSFAKFSSNYANANNSSSEPDNKISFNYGQDNQIVVDKIDNISLNDLDSSKFYNKNNFKYYDNSLVVIDVSSHQDEIDWKKVKDSGVDGVMVRVAYRGYTEGQIYEDSYFKYNIQEALNNNLKVGIYFFSQAINENEAIEEAEYTYNLIKNYDITLPVAFDWEIINENNSRTKDFSSNKLTSIARSFCDKIKNKGYQPMIYFNQYLGYTYYDLSEFSDCKFWYVEYDDTPNFTYKFDMWQYTEKASVSGIHGAVDANILF